MILKSPHQIVTEINKYISVVVKSYLFIPLDDWYSDIEDMIIAHFQYWNLKSICFTKQMMYIILYDRHDKLFSH